MKNETRASILAGKNLKRAIKSSKWKTFTAFAIETGFALRTIRRYCNEGIDSLDNLAFLAKKLEIDVFALLP